MRSSAPSPAALLGVAGAGLAFGALAEAVAFHEFGTVRAVADFTSGMAFLGAGILAWSRRPAYLTGPLMIGTTFAWFAGNFRHAEHEPLAYTLAILTQGVFVAMLIHLVVAFPTGRTDVRLERAVIASAYFVATVLLVPAYLFLEPREQGCSGCDPGLNLLLVEANDEAYGLANGVLVASVGGVLLVMIYAISRRWRAASEQVRRVLAPPIVAGVVSLAILAVGPAVQGIDAQGDDDAERTQALLRDICMMLFPLAFLIGLRGTRAGRSPVSRLLRRISDAAAPGGLREHLAEALGDASLELGFWLPSSGRYVDAQGNEMNLPPPGSARGATLVEGDSGPLAVLVHDAVLLEHDDLVRGVADVARLALERERLQAEVRAQLREVRASRARIVHAGDVERRRIERDLHDGTQQRLLSLSLGLRLLEERMNGQPTDPAVREILAEVQESAHRAIEELRELARGIHPQVLTDAGLEAALELLGSRLPLPLVIAVDFEHRPPPPVEAGAYFVCAEALTNVVKHARARSAEVTATLRDGAVYVAVSDDGVGGATARSGTGIRGLLDRIEALGGRLDIHSPPGGGTRVSAQIPCAVVDDQASTATHG